MSLWDFNKNVCVCVSTCLLSTHVRVHTRDAIMLFHIMYHYDYYYYYYYEPLGKVTIFTCRRDVEWKHPIFFLKKRWSLHAHRKLVVFGVMESSEQTQCTVHILNRTFFIFHLFKTTGFVDNEVIFDNYEVKLEVFFNNLSTIGTFFIFFLFF